MEAPLELSSGMGSSNIPSHVFDVEIDFAGIIKFPVRAGFTVGMDNYGFGLLGQTDFFERFNVSFRLDKGIFEIDIP